jgi:Domain of unknown function (DUF6748)
MRSASSYTLLALCAAIGAQSACSTPAHAQAKPVGESATTAAAGPIGYYAISSDLRRCSYPTCGGWFLGELNRSTTTCHDGQTADQCYTPVLDWSNTNVTETQQSELLDAARTGATSGHVYAIVRGTFARTNHTTPQPQLGRFVIAEAWVAEGDGAAAGAFVHVKDNGLRCFAAPCSNLTETTLNTSQVTNIADVDFAPSGMSDAEVAQCTEEMYGPIGILVAGDRYTVQVDDRTAPGRTATQAYVQLGSATP